MSILKIEELHILQYQLKTKRQKKRLVKEAKDKYLLKIHRSISSLYAEKRALGWVELEEPYQKGWKRSFKLRDDVKRSKKSGFYQHILDKINTTVYSDRKDFKVKKKRRSQYGYVVKVQKLFEPCEYQLKGLKLNDRELQQFCKVTSYNKLTKRWKTNYVFLEPWRFELRVEPNMITKHRAYDPLLESSIDELTNYMWKNDFNKRLRKLLDGCYGHWSAKMFEKEKYKNPMKGNSLNAFLGKEHWVLN
ncbi:hypothetical protein [Solitalea canadensis]|nr:hypothetical protein [Solitalea canadensis]